MPKMHHSAGLPSKRTASVDAKQAMAPLQHS